MYTLLSFPILSIDMRWLVGQLSSLNGASVFSVSPPCFILGPPFNCVSIYICMKKKLYTMSLNCNIDNPHPTTVYRVRVLRTFTDNVFGLLKRQGRERLFVSVNGACSYICEMISRAHRIESYTVVVPARPLAFFNSFPPALLQFTVLPLLRHDIFLVYLSHQLSLCLILCSRGWMVDVERSLSRYCTTFRSRFHVIFTNDILPRSRRFPIESSQRCPFSSL